MSRGEFYPLEAVALTGFPADYVKRQIHIPIALLLWAVFLGLCFCDAASAAGYKRARTRKLPVSQSDVFYVKVSESKRFACVKYRFSYKPALMLRPGLAQLISAKIRSLQQDLKVAPDSALPGIKRKIKSFKAMQKDRAPVCAAGPQAPVAYAASYDFDEMGNVSVTLEASDQGGADLLFSVADPPKFGTLTGDGRLLVYHGTTRDDSFTFKASNGRLESQPAAISLNVLRAVPEVRVVQGEDYEMPDWVSPEPFSGYAKSSAGGRVALKTLWLHWRDLEPQRGQYNFSAIETALSNARAGGYKVILFILSHVLRGYDSSSGITVGNSVPDWVTDPDYEFAPVPTGWLHGQFDLEVIPIWRPDLRDAFNSMIREFGRQGYPQREELGAAYIHGISSERGEEFFLSYDTVVDLEMQLDFSRSAAEDWIMSKMDAYAEAFEGVVHKLAWVNNSKWNFWFLPGGVPSEYVGMAWDLTEYAWSLGIGSRNGGIEYFNGWATDPVFGQSVDDEGYLHTDESHIPIASGGYYGDENEEYGDGWRWRFPSPEDEPFAYRMAVLRSLQMLMRFLVTSDAAEAVNPALSEWVRHGLGKSVYTAADAFACLRESPVSYNVSQTGSLKNTERWLIQRDVADGITVPAELVSRSFDAGSSRRINGQWVDYRARRTNLAVGNPAMYFALDDRFISDKETQIKVEYVGRAEAAFHLEYTDRLGQVRSTPSVQVANDGIPRTATFAFSRISFLNAFASGMDFKLVSEGPGDVTVRFVRVVRMQQPD